ncbi:MAG: tetratricopeptide repeat protein [Chloroflexia bacterium]|nr:tetratricopeptide repeat protein [Chloroflexia bacterium]
MHEQPVDGRDSLEMTLFEIPGPEGQAKQLVSLGMRHSQDGKLEDAVLAFEKAVEAAPRNPVYRVDLAAAYRELLLSGTICDDRRSEALFERACDQLLNALRIEPDFAPAYRALGFLYRDMEASWRAREMWTYFLEIEPTGPRAAEVKAALADLDRVQNLHQLCEEASYLVNHNEPERGMQLLREVIEEEPTWYEAWFWSGLACRELELMDEGIHAFAQAVELDPESCFAYHELAALLARKGEREAAEGFWRRSLQLEPDEPWIMSNLALLLWQDDRRTEAEALLARAFDIDPANRRLRLRLRALQEGQPAPTEEL